jgi:hypothetical protein
MCSRSVDPECTQTRAPDLPAILEVPPDFYTDSTCWFNRDVIRGGEVMSYHRLKLINAYSSFLMGRAKHPEARVEACIDFFNPARYNGCAVLGMQDRGAGMQSARASLLFCRWRLTLSDIAPSRTALFAPRLGVLPKNKSSSMPTA